jgi:hypothetical protein
MSRCLLSKDREPSPPPLPEPKPTPTLRELILRAISPTSRTRADVRRDLVKHFRRGGPPPRVPSVHDDSDDIDALLDLMKDELKKRGIGGEK